MMALASATRMESTLTQFFRPRVKGRMARSAVLLSMGTFPSVRKNRRYSSWFRLYWSALQVLPPAGTFGRDVSGLYLWFYRKAHPGGITRRSASHPVWQRFLRVPEYRYWIRMEKSIRQDLFLLVC